MFAPPSSADICSTPARNGNTVSGRVSMPVGAQASVKERLSHTTIMRITRQILKCLFGAMFALAGANHFINTDFYVGIMPPYLPWHSALVYLSGAIEMVLGIMLLFSRVERLAAWGMIALIVAVTPAHIQMALHPELYPGYSQAALWGRLAFQGVLIAWAFWYTRPRPVQQHLHSQSLVV